ncbi:hypothetical protein [Leptolyngbya sp. NIES-2104]|uniref:hypothetical protein n=1 Tax=Leptolyngbya sp. NIES-2104 TaxID=1552121 RepID=UPI0006ECA408|nr:hypothetical protein [Leptolyngbya sp. NIES-2104]GAQ00115.1 hypothetical protein NIES2104_66800 [Leptolyngbya sp. NIES-2104]
MANSFHVSLPTAEARLIEEAARYAGTTVPQVIRTRLREWEDLRQFQIAIAHLENQLDAMHFLLELIAIDAASEKDKLERQAMIDRINQRLAQTIHSRKSISNPC